MTAPVVVLGAGLAGWTVAREFRKLDSATPVMLVTADNGDFYAKPSLSNAFAQGRAPAQLVTTAAEKMAQTQGVTLLPRTWAQGIDAAARTLATSGGPLAYSQLVLATGAKAIRVPLQGDAVDTVRSINSLDDFAQFHANLRPGAHVAILGAGLIGCEFANDLAAAGHPVSVIDPMSRPLAALLPEGAGLALQAALTGLGVRWHFNTTASTVLRHGQALRVELANGEAIAADAVLSAVGLRADTQLAQAAGLACERGIVVDAALRTSDASIFSLGDGAQYASAGGRTLPYVMPIMSAARVLATQLAGQGGTLVFPLMPVAVKTPALPLVVAAPAPGTVGRWEAGEAGDEGIWQFVDDTGASRGFVLAGRQTARRAELAKRVAA